MDGNLITFYILACVAIGAALGMLLSKNAVYAALFLILNFAVVAVFYLILGAPFIAMAQVTVYAGAIMVLFLFVIMLLNLQEDPTERGSRPWLWLSGGAGALFALVVVRSLGGSLGGLPGPGVAAAVPEGYGTTTAIGQRLFTDYVLAFEITGVLLLVAVIGAVVVAKRRLG